MTTRRDILRFAAVTSLLRGARVFAAEAKMTLNTRAIPKSGEQLPVVGLGTWQTFDVGAGADERKAVREVLAKFLGAGMKVIDSSPMYRRAEEVTGDELAGIKDASPFLATKVWTRGKQAGIEEMERSLRRMRTKTMDLMQVHNLLDVKTHLPVLREWKAAGKIRYLGVTHYQHGEFDAIEKLMKTEKLDFIQIPFSIVDRLAEKRILPTAADTGTAVLVMTPFESGELFTKVKGKPLPALAADLDCTSWAQFFLKFIIGHPAVTCPIPATAKASHVIDNVQAARGRLPDAKQRDKMAATFVRT
ncbi:MAG TPA: aldo/keto reductase [Kofleriaceae bacterium]|nr:aldo/keto reductase [Kofleriaceae bacterium]